VNVTNPTLDIEAIAEVVEGRRRELHLSQRQLAGLADVSPGTISDYLHRRPKDYAYEPLSKVSRALGLGDDGLWEIGHGDDPEAVKARAQEADVADLIVQARATLERFEEFAPVLHEQISALEQRLAAAQRRPASPARP
jgi:transcriptional regulator with XRE-family HTH domain